MSERIATIVKLPDGTYEIRIAFTSKGLPTTWQITGVHKLVVDPKIIEEEKNAS
jgi:hypothetical protein